MNINSPVKKKKKHIGRDLEVESTLPVMDSISRSASGSPIDGDAAETTSELGSNEF